MRGIERTQLRALRLCLLVLAIARAGSEGLSRADLENLPETQALYNGGVQARYAAILRDLETLTGQSLRERRQGAPGHNDVMDDQASLPYGDTASPVVYDATKDRYRLRHPAAEPLRLSSDALEALCVVARALHGGTTLPGGRELFDRVSSALGEDERQKLESALDSESLVRRSAITLDLGLRETTGGLELVMSRLGRAWRERRTVEFSYRAKGGVTHHYGDEVIGLWLTDHAYASVWCEEANGEIEVRLDRILPETLRFSPNVAQGRQHRGILIRYRLDAEIARGEVTQRLEGQTVEWEADGAAIVTGRARSLFWARQLVLRYGAHALALEPQALVAALKREAQRLSAVYEGDNDRDEPKEGR